MLKAKNPKIFVFFSL